MNIVKFFDEINALEKYRRDNRIKLAQELEKRLVVFTRAIYEDMKKGDFLRKFSKEYYLYKLYEMMLVVSLVIMDDEEQSKLQNEMTKGSSELRTHLYKAAEQIVDTTIDAYLEPETGTKFDELRATGQPIPEELFPDSLITALGRERIQMIAANESLYINNYVEQQQAVNEGKKFKVWHTMEDERVRVTHEMVNRKEIPINEAFTVGVSKLMFPGDTSMNAEPSEIILCRCYLTYK